MQTYSVVNCRRQRGARSLTLFLLQAGLLCGLLFWASAPVLAQGEPQQTAGQGAQEPLQQGAAPDTDQTKITQPPPGATSATTASVTLTTIRDEQGMMSVAVPTGWNEIAEGEWRIADAPVGVTLSASPNQAEFVTNWGTPGIALFYSTSLPAAMDPQDLLEVFDFSGTCTAGRRGALPPAQRSVIYQVWQDCAGTTTATAVLVISPTNGAYYAVVEVYLTRAEDVLTLGPILRSVQFAALDESAAGVTPVPGEAAGPATDAAATDAAATATLAAPTPTPAPSPTAVPILATVITDRLNLRSGPSTDVPRITVVTRGMELTVSGQTGACAWLQVVAPDGQQGWISGDPQFASLGAACAEVPLVENP
jgi:hypothetical protein